MQLQHVAVQLVGILLHPFGRIIAKQGFLQTVETGEFRIGRFLLEIIFTGVNAAIKVREQLGDRLNALVMLTGWRVEGFRFFDITGLHRIGKGFGCRCQIRRLFRDVRFIRGNRIAKAQYRSAFRRIGRRFTFDDKLPFRVGQQTAGHLILARLQVGGHLLAEARSDIFALLHHQNTFQDLPLQRLLAVVLNNKLGFTAVHREGHRLTLLVVDGDLNLWNIRAPGGKCRSEQRGNACA